MKYLDACKEVELSYKEALTPQQVRREVELCEDVFETMIQGADQCERAMLGQGHKPSQKFQQISSEIRVHSLTFAYPFSQRIYMSPNLFSEYTHASLNDHYFQGFQRGISA